MFKLTAEAAAQVKVAALQSGTEGMALRLAARKKDDGSIEYAMGFDEPSEDDIRVESADVTIVMAPEYAPLLDTAVLDFARLDDSDEVQFIFINPQDANFSPAD